MEDSWPIHIVVIEDWLCREKDEALKHLIEGIFIQTFDLLDDYINGDRGAVDGLKRMSMIIGEPSLAAQLKRDKYFRTGLEDSSRWKWLICWLEENRQNIFKHEAELTSWKNFSEENKLSWAPPAPFELASTEKIKYMFRR